MENADEEMPIGSATAHDVDSYTDFRRTQFIAERSEASNPGRTTEMSVVLYESPSNFWYVSGP